MVSKKVVVFFSVWLCVKRETMQLEPLNQKQVRLLPVTMQHEYFSGDRSFARYGVAGDGTCFFHSVCAARNTKNYLTASINDQQKTGRKFRCAFTDHLTDQRWARFLKQRKIESSVDAAEARDHFCNNKHWADETMIRYVSDVLKMNIVFIDADTGQIYCGVRGHKKEPLVIVMWINRSHFEPVARIRGVGDKEVGIQLVFDPDDDADVVDGIMRHYQAQCAE